MFPCDASTLTFQRIDEDKKILIARTCFLKGGEKQVWQEILHKISSSSSWKTKTNIVFVIHVLSNWTNFGCGWKNWVGGWMDNLPQSPKIELTKSHSSIYGERYMGIPYYVYNRAD